MKKLTVDDVIILFLLISVVIISLKGVVCDSEIKHLRNGVAFLYKVSFYEAGTPEPILDSESLKFISKGEVLPNGTNTESGNRGNEHEPKR